MNFYRHIKNFMFLILPLIVLTNEALALSVTSAKTIQGTIPKLKSPTNNLPLTSSNVKDIVHFQVPNTSSSNYDVYYGDTNTLTALNTTYFPKTLRYVDFDPNHWDSHLFYDVDGDGFNTNASITPQSGETINTTYPFIGYDSVESTWKDKNGNIVNHNSTDTLNPCLAPYQLTITYTKLRVRSQYGDPSVSVIDNDLNGGTKLTQTFPINMQPDICYLKPANMMWAKWGGSPERPQETTGYAVYSPPTNSKNFGGGLDNNQFDPDNGFSASISVDKFPTTAFKNAKFNIITSPSSASYSFSSSDNSVAMISGNTVIFNNKPSSFPYPITITGIASGRPTLTYTFSIKLWATPKAQALSQAWANANCTGTAGLFSRAELTNMDLISWSNIKSNPMSNAVYIRKIGSLSGEWGRTTAGDYPNSNWNSRFYWTNETMTGSNVNGKAWLWGPYWGRLQVQDASEVTANGNPYVVCKN